MTIRPHKDTHGLGWALTCDTPHCHKSTLARAAIYGLTSDGPWRIGEYAYCEECGWSPYGT